MTQNDQMTQNSQNDRAAIVPAGTSVANTMEGQAIARTAETSGMAMAEQAKALVQARYQVAMLRPRDFAVARERILQHCRRPTFAKSARYNKPVGTNGIRGPSIRLAEACAQALGNITTEAATVYDDPDKIVVRVSSTDLEVNITYSADAAVQKTIERSRPMQGRKIIGVRKNSKGYDVYEIEATNDEVAGKVGAAVSKAMRNCQLRLVPSDLLEEALAQCVATEAGEVKKDPAAARKGMVDKFGELGIRASDISEYLGCPAMDATEEQIVEMRGLYVSIQEQQTTWKQALSDVLDERKPRATEEGGAGLAERIERATKATPDKG